MKEINESKLDLEKENQTEFECSANSGKPVSLHRMIPDEVFENLPEQLKKITENYDGRERDIILLSSLGVLSSCMPNVIGVYDKRGFSPNLYLFIIAPPASGKGVMTKAKLLIDPVHDKIVKKSQTLIKECKDNESNFKPKIQLKVVPGNTSSASFYSHMQNAKESLLIFESEADSLSNMMKNDWGDFSDLLRKAFQHETMSIARKTDDIYYNIKAPQLSIVISGTPGQLKPLIQSKENGLFSRFNFYFFEGSSGWKDVSPSASQINFDEVFNEQSKVISNLYNNLEFRKEKLEILLDTEQWELFQNEMRFLTSVFKDSNKEEFIPVVYRLGITVFRLSMILTVLRSSKIISKDINQLNCDNKDLNIALELMRIFIEHSLFVFEMYEKGSLNLTIKERNLHNSLPNFFTRKEGLNIGLELNFKERTFDTTLKRWVSMKILTKTEYGKYQKNELD